MATKRKRATKAKSRKSLTKAKSRKRTVTAKSRKAVARKTKPAKRAAKPRARKRVVSSKARKAAVSSKARKPAKKATRKSAKKAHAQQSSTAAPKAVRLTFSYRGDQVKLLSQQRVEMTVLPSDAVKGYEQQKGFWAEVKSDQDKTLFRRVLHNPTRNDAEVFSDDPEQSISRAPAPKRKGVFVVVVPDTEKAHEVTLSRSTVPPDMEAQGGPKGMTAMRSLATGPATEIARFKLKK